MTPLLSLVSMFCVTGRRDDRAAAGDRRRRRSQRARPLRVLGAHGRHPRRPVRRRPGDRQRRPATVARLRTRPRPGPPAFAPFCPRDAVLLRYITHTHTRLTALYPGLPG